MDLHRYMKLRREEVDRALDQFLPQGNEFPQRLNEAVRYSIFAGGKRLRPILALAAAEALNHPVEPVLPVACSLEMIHTYSLIHDDLPAMDDDDLRRGRPTNHKVYGEAMAILAGDSLLTTAFLTVARYNQNGRSEITLKVLECVAQAAGVSGMVGGQAQDLMSEGKRITPKDLEHLHRHKTGALIQVSVEAGALVAGASGEDFQALSRYGRGIGLSFQIADDLLDIEGTAEIGKDLGSDLKKGKATYPSILGMEESRRLADELTKDALKQLERFESSADPLREIAKYVVYRRS